jgi:hypothetical protein
MDAEPDHRASLALCRLMWGSQSWLQPAFSRHSSPPDTMYIDARPSGYVQTVQDRHRFGAQPAFDCAPPSPYTEMKSYFGCIIYYDRHSQKQNAPRGANGCPPAGWS